MKPPNIKGQRKKEIRRIEKRKNRLYKQLWNLGYEKLEKPIRHGWYRELIITENVHKYKNASAILEIYEYIVPWYWATTKEKAQAEWDKRCSLFMISKDKPTISRKQFNKLSEKAQKLCVVFRYKTVHRNVKTRFYINFPKGCYRFQFKRAYITHRKRIDPSIISEIEFLEKELHKKGYFDLYQSLYSWDPGWSHYLAYEARKRQRKMKQKIRMLNKESIEDLVKDKVSWEIN